MGQKTCPKCTHNGDKHDFFDKEDIAPVVCPECGFIINDQSIEMLEMIRKSPQTPRIKEFMTKSWKYYFGQE